MQFRRRRRVTNSLSLCAKPEGKYPARFTLSLFPLVCWRENVIGVSAVERALLVDSSQLRLTQRGILSAPFSRRTAAHKLINTSDVSNPSIILVRCGTGGPKANSSGSTNRSSNAIDFMRS